MATVKSRLPRIQRSHAALSDHRSASGLPLYVLLLLLAFVFMFPFFWTLSSSLKATWELTNFPPSLFPEVPQWQNYPYVFERAPFWTWMQNTITVVVWATLGSVLTASIVAYSFARFEYRGRDLVFLVTLGTMMLPQQVIMIPQYVLFHKLGWVNTLRPLWVPNWFGGGAFYIFLLRQFIMSLPRELDEAAMIDGASFTRVFRSVIVPLSTPALATVTIICFMNNWNDFDNAVIFLHSPKTFTLAIGMNFFKTVPEIGGVPMENILMAASVMATVPCLVLFFAAQRYFVEGVVLTGLKG
ncbi:MAG: carbohydrate ABC transporter permease [Chloroflexi bacterium]|nr:carbohydrate ABC transporter permease [Chloroflexota bacterium]